VLESPLPLLADNGGRWSLPFKFRMLPFRALMGPKAPGRIPVAASVFGFLSIMKVPPPKSTTLLHVVQPGCEGGAWPHVWLTGWPEYYTRRSSLQIWLFLESACLDVAAKKTGSKEFGKWGKRSRASASNEAWNFSTLATVSHFFILLFQQLFLYYTISFFFFFGKNMLAATLVICSGWCISVYKYMYMYTQKEKYI